MKFGVALFPLRSDQMVDVAIAGESLGFDCVFLGEHVISPIVSHSQYPYAKSTDEAPTYHPGLPFYDPYAALSFLAARTRTIKLCVSLSIVPLHDPYHLARSIMTIDRFSGQRFLFGIGAGWLREEFEIVGMDWSTRGRRLDEVLDLLQVLWTEPEPAFEGEFYRLPPSRMEPKPLSQPHPPYIFGGTTPAAIRRAARRGDGWFGVGVDAAQTRDIVARIRELRPAELPPIEVTVGLPFDAPVDDRTIEEFADAGVDRLVVRPWVSGREAVDNLQRLAAGLDITSPV